MRCRQRQARLADAAGADERHEAMGPKQRRHRREIVCPAVQRRQRDRQIARRGGLHECRAGLGFSVVGRRDRAWSWFGVGAMGTAYGLGKANVPSTVQPPVLGNAPPAQQDGASWYRFSSQHPRMVNFAFGDGSVRSLRAGNTTTPDLSGNPKGNNGSDWAVLQQLAGRSDGFIHDTSAIEQ